jgi:eukaryotic-like serine/threonine-protein kinase
MPGGGRGRVLVLQPVREGDSGRLLSSSAGGGEGDPDSIRGRMKSLTERFRGFIAELRRRRVIRVGVIYVIVAFPVLQAADILFPALHLPDWALSFTAALAILGFPVAVALAWAFDITPSGVVRTVREEGPSGKGSGGETAEARPRHRPVPKAAWFVLGILVALSGAWFGASHLGLRDAGTSLDADAVMVLPFRVGGADPQFHYLREGVVVLLNAKLTGEWGPRAVDLQTTMAQLRQSAGDEGADLSRDEAALLARNVGAGGVVLGELVTTPGRLVLTARLVEPATARSRPPVTVEGSADSLTVLVDRLAAGLLSQEAGEAEHRLAGLTSTSVEALRHYLAATADYRVGRFDSALEGYQRALAADSTFALAAMGVVSAAGWILVPTDVAAAALAKAWAHQERLSPRDRLYLRALAGAEYPLPRTARARLERWEVVVERHPDDPEAWYQVGDAYFHYASLGPEHWARAESAFQRAVELDPDYVPALLHLADLSGITGDTARVRRRVERYLEVDSVGFYARYLSVNAGRILGDTTVEVRLRESLPETDFMLLIALSMVGPLPGLDTRFPWATAFETGELALEVARATAGTGEERRVVARRARAFALDRGRIDEARRAFLELRDAGADPVEILALQVEDALYWDADTAEGAEAAEGLSRHLGPAEGWADLLERASPISVRALCTLQQWQLARGDAADAPRAAEVLRRLAEADPRGAGRPAARVCAELLEAWSAHVEGSPEAGARLAALEAFLQEGQSGAPQTPQATLALARILEASGDVDGAARVASWVIYHPDYLLYITTFLRTQAELAARSGDTEKARELYALYLAFVSHPTPGTRPAEEAQRAREALAGL